MGKIRKTHSVLINEWVRNIPTKRHFRIESSKIFCEPCCKLYDFKQHGDFIKHTQSRVHLTNSTKFDAKPELQGLLTDQAIPRNEFFEDLTESFVSAGIPWSKLSNPHLRNFLQKYANRKIPDESTLRKNYLKRVYAKAMDSIRSEIADSPVWIAIDETTDESGRFIAALLVGALRKDKSSEPHLLMVRELDNTNNETITRQVLDSFDLLWPNHTQADIDAKFFLFLTDGVNYMKKTGKNLKPLYPKLLHVTCLAHGINRVAEEIRGHYPEVDKLIGAIKAAFRKAPHRVQKFHTICPGVPLPPRPVITRWGTWLEAVEYYAHNFNGVKAVVDSLDPDDAKCIEVAQSQLVNGIARKDPAFVSANNTFLTATLCTLQEAKSKVSDVLDLIGKTKDILAQAKGAGATAVNGKLRSILSKNEDLAEIEMSGIINGNEEEPSGIVATFDPCRVAAFKFAPLTTVHAERSFSVQKAIFTDRRRRLTVENLN